MFCTKCGKKLMGTEKFCPACGGKIRSKEAPNSRLKTGAGVGLATQVGVTVLFYYIIFILLLTCTPADEKGFRIATIICFVPILLICVWIIIGSTDYIIVEGNQFYARRNLKKYTFRCSDLQTINYIRRANVPFGGITCGVNLILQDNKVLHAEHGYKKVFKADYKYKNYRRFAGYLAALHDAGVIAEEVITPEEKEKLLMVANGKLR